MARSPTRLRTAEPRQSGSPPQPSRRSQSSGLRNEEGSGGLSRRQKAGPGVAAPAQTRRGGVVAAARGRGCQPCEQPEAVSLATVSTATALDPRPLAIPCACPCASRCRDHRSRGPHPIPGCGSPAPAAPTVRPHPPRPGPPRPTWSPKKAECSRLSSPRSPMEPRPPQSVCAPPLGCRGRGGRDGQGSLRLRGASDGEAGGSHGGAGGDSNAKGAKEGGTGGPARAGEGSLEGLRTWEGRREEIPSEGDGGGDQRERRRRGEGRGSNGVGEP